MPFCPHCGNEVEQLPDAVAVAETVSADVRIAEIQAERDIEVARISARVDKDFNETRADIAETEAEAQVATAEAEAEVIGEILAEGAMPEEPEQDLAPVIVQDGGGDPEEPDAPPPAEPGSGEPKTSSNKRVGLGMW